MDRSATCREEFSRLVAGDVPDVDLVIRTGGDRRLSDFLLWESAYAELLFVERAWPDFGPAHLLAASPSSPSAGAGSSWPDARPPRRLDATATGRWAAAWRGMTAAGIKI